VILNHKGHFTVGLVGATHFTIDPCILVYEVPIVVHGQAEGFGQGAILLKNGCFIENIIGLPVTGGPAGID
jgi:hypothetical protein